MHEEPIERQTTGEGLIWIARHRPNPRQRNLVRFVAFAAAGTALAAPIMVWNFFDAGDQTLRVFFTGTVVAAELVGLAVIFLAVVLPVLRRTTEIEITPDALRVTERRGLFSSTRTAPKNAVRAVRAQRSYGGTRAGAGEGEIIAGVEAETRIPFGAGLPLALRETLAAEVSTRLGLPAESPTPPARAGSPSAGSPPGGTGLSPGAPAGGPSPAQGRSASSTTGASVLPRLAELKHIPAVARLTNTTFGLAIFALIWNAIVWISIGALIISGESVPVFASLILALFAAVGIGLAVAFVRALLVRARMKPARLEVSPHPVRLGETIRLRYRQEPKGPVDVERVTLRLVLREIAVFTQGTSTSSVTHDVHSEEREILRDRKADPSSPLEAEAEFTLPPDLMHTFTARRNAILWILTVRCVLRGWPDYKEDFALEVVPERVRTAAGAA